MVEVYRGREDAISAMLDYGRGLAISYLESVFSDEARLTPEFLRRAVLTAESGELGATIPFNWVMIATFFRTGLDISHRIIRWCREQELDWSRTMALICGQQGRPTSGVTLGTNSIAQMIIAASDHRLPLDRLYIAPHGRALGIVQPSDLEPVRTASFVLFGPTRGRSQNSLQPCSRAIRVMLRVPMPHRS